MKCPILGTFSNLSEMPLKAFSEMPFGAFPIIVFIIIPIATN